MEQPDNQFEFNQMIMGEMIAEDRRRRGDPREWPAEYRARLDQRIAEGLRGTAQALHEARPQLAAELFEGAARLDTIRELGYTDYDPVYTPDDQKTTWN